MSGRVGGRGRRSSAVTALGIAALAALVGVAISGDGVLTAAAVLDGADRRAVRIGGIVAILAGVAGLWLERGRIRAVDPRGGDPSAAGLRVAAGLIIALALIGLLDPPPAVDRATSSFGSGADPGMRAGDVGGGSEPSGLTGGGESLGRGERLDLQEIEGVQNAGEEESGTRQMGRRVAAGILALLAALVAARLLQRAMGIGESGADPVEEDEPATEGPGVAPPHDFGAELAAALERLRASSGPPAERVALAYEAALVAFAAVGVGRRAEEAPHEHLRRAAATLGRAPGDAEARVPPGGVGERIRTPAHRLAGLHVAGRFGDRPLGPADGDAARSALEAILELLRGRMDDRTRPPAPPEARA